MPNGMPYDRSAYVLNKYRNKSGNRDASEGYTRNSRNTAWSVFTERASRGEIPWPFRGNGDIDEPGDNGYNSRNANYKGSSPTAHK